MAGEIHDGWVDVIKALKMPFPNSQHPNWRTITHGKMGVRKGETTVYPDLVVLDESDSIIMIGEVETASSVDAAEVAQWKVYGAMAQPFYLYVPEGQEGTTRSLAVNARVTGIRAYSVDASGSAQIRKA